MIYNAADLTSFAREVLFRAGLPVDRALLVAETLVASDLMGHTTHGLQLLKPYAKQVSSGEMKAQGEPTVVKDSGSAITWDGQYLPGPYLVHSAIDLAMERLYRHPQVSVVIGRSHHIACLAAYLERATQAGYIIILITSDPSHRSVAPYGGVTPVYSPDPLAYGVPTEGDPILFDSSLSAVAYGVIKQTKDEGGRLAGKWLLTANGEDTDDPTALFDNPPATILPLGGMDRGFKGFGMGILVEALTSGLAGHGRKDQMTRWSSSVLLQLIDPEQFGGLASLQAEMQYLVDQSKASATRPGFEEVRIPGERALAKKKEQLKSGVHLGPTIVKDLRDCAEEYNIEVFY